MQINSINLLHGFFKVIRFCFEIGKLESAILFAWEKGDNFFMKRLP